MRSGALGFGYRGGRLRPPLDSPRRGFARNPALWALLALLASSGCHAKEPAKAPRVAPAVVALRPQPKPGERVRQPELDGYCADAQRSSAFYYHGGRPVMPLARKDGCAPLFMVECEADGRCVPARDQEPGMWCCAATGPVAQAKR